MAAIARIQVSASRLTGPSTNRHFGQKERKAWRKDHPKDFWARPTTKPDGSQDLLNWRCGIPGREGTIWAEGVYTVHIEFPSKPNILRACWQTNPRRDAGGYPIDPPKVMFSPPIYHPNVFDNGQVCLSILKTGGDYKPSISLKELLVVLQDLLTTPNNDDPAQRAASQDYRNNMATYERKVKAQALKFKKKDDDNDDD